jgi:DNA-binding transcriptional ArsR family regulator
VTHRAAPDYEPLPIDRDAAEAIAEIMQALSAPSRVRILGRLAAGPCSVGDLTDEVEMEQSAVSHQLRLLRHLGLVTRDRKGRQAIYALHDPHVAVLLAEAIYHVEHVRLGLRDVPRAAEAPAP